MELWHVVPKEGEEVKLEGLGDCGLLDEESAFVETKFDCCGGFGGLGGGLVEDARGGGAGFDDGSDEGEEVRVDRVGS